MIGESIPESATILAVDDEPVNVHLLERMLAQAGYRSVVSTTRPSEVLPLFRQHRPDLLLLDLHMPGMHGLDVLEQLRGAVPEGEYFPILVLTADTTRESRERALAAGAKDFLTKPLERTETLLRIRNLLETRLLHRMIRRDNERLEQAVRERTRDLERALHEAEAARRAKSQFLHNMSHELRTPLTAIHGAHRLLQRRFAPSLPEQGQRLLEIASRGAARLISGVEEILYLQSLQGGDVEFHRAPVDVPGLVAALLPEFRQRAGAAGVTLVSELPEDAAPLWTDGDRLRDLLARLLDNAVRFTERGEIRVRVPLDPGTRHPEGVQVEDTGSGIPPERLPHVFEPFTQADESDARRHEGMGLGLAVARALGEGLGHTLEIESEWGRGTLARVRFPAPATGPRAVGEHR